MTVSFRAASFACVAGLLLSGAAVAAPALPLGASAPTATATEVALVMKGTRAGNMKQRHRTRLDRCRNTPSRC